MKISKLKIHPKFEPLYYPKRYKVYHGGRNGMKTFSFCEALTIKSSQQKLKIICGRQFWGTINDSVKPAIEKQIYRFGLDKDFLIYDKIITNKYTGSTFEFKGLDRNIMSIKGWEDIDIFWGEEANTISEKAWDLLTKTIRKPGSEIWLSFNRHSRTDTVDKRFLSKNADVSNAVVVQTSYRDNVHLSAEQEAERLYDKEHKPERYRHIWLGEPDDSGGKHSVLPYEKLSRCIDAHLRLKYKPSGMKYSGLDVADDGKDTNAWSLRHGSLLMKVDEWKVKFLHMTASKADFRNKKNNVVKMHYDASGLGAGIKSDLSKIKIDPETGLGLGISARRFIPFHFGGKVKGPNKPFIRHSQLKIKNKDFFSRANAQAWWNLRLRLENTLKALNGDKVNLDRCLFINGNITNIDKIISELSQCVYEDTTGKIKIDKAPDGQESPNLADSVVLSFANDIKHGLKSTM